jgi:eukaryotic-like serine/threonine-protein kinase
MTTPSASAANAVESTTTADAAASMAQAMDDLSGQTLGDFKLLRKLGAGGMGQVYLAEQISLNRRVAVKLLRAELNSNEKFRKRFETEAKAAAKLNHPSIVQVYSVGEHDGMMFMALEYVEGWTLREYLLRKGPPDLPVALTIMRQVAGALARAAELGIVHRDIKPENILLTRKVEVKVTDFGLAKILAGLENNNLTQTGVSMGTPLYMSPEQVQGQELDPRSDIYCFGATCYHLLSGQPPFTAETAITLAFKHVSEEPVPLSKLRPDLPPELCALVSTMMAKKPEKRYQSAREILRDLKKLADGRTGSVPTGPIAKLPIPPDALQMPVGQTTEDYFELDPPPRRTWLWVIGGSVLAAILLGGIVGLMLRNNREGTSDSTVASGNTGTKTAGTGPHATERLRLEQRLLEEVKRTSDVPLDRPRQFQVVEDGLRARVELLYYYLVDTEKAPNIPKAREFLGTLVNSPNPQYQLLGRLGSGICLSYDNRWSVTSITHFRDVMNSKMPVQGVIDPKPVLYLIRRMDRELAELVVDAIDRNKKNLEAVEKKEYQLPPEVRQLYNAAKERLTGQPQRPNRPRQ